MTRFPRLSSLLPTLLRAVVRPFGPAAVSGLAWVVLAVVVAGVPPAAIARPGGEGTTVADPPLPPAPPPGSGSGAARTGVTTAGPFQQAPFAVRLADWTQVLRYTDRYVIGADHTDELSQSWLDKVKAVVLAAAQARDTAQQDMEATQLLIVALGAPPDDNAPPEPKDIVAKRKQLNEELATHKAHVAQADIAIAQGRRLEASISTLRRTQLLYRLQQRDPVPLSPPVVGAALVQAAGVLHALSTAPQAWYATLSDAESEDIGFLSLTAFLFGGGLAGWSLGRILLRRFGHDATIAEPSYARRLTAAIAEGVARGLVPAALLAVGYGWSVETITGLFGDVLASLIGVTFFVVVVAGLSRAVLSPHLPAWRITDLMPDNARLIARGLLVLAVVFAIDMFFHDAVASLPVDPELKSVYRLLFTGLEALALIILARRRLWSAPDPVLATDGESPAVATGRESEGTSDATRWQPVVPAAPDPGPSSPATAPSLRFWRALRRVVIGLVVASLVATAAGYVEFGTYLVHNLLFTGVIVAGLGLARNLLQELLEILMESELLRTRLGVRLGTVKAMDFWSRAVLDPMILVAGLVVVGPLWGVPRDDLTRWGRLLLTGIPIGNVTLSLADLATAVAVFFIAMVVTRLFQRRLAERILPGTRLDVSTQHSLATIVGYVGVVIALAVSVSVAGFDLGNLALVAGALSVGIGFGMQNIVNNFVSGLILLIERPIRVGDWVVVGDSEGTVRRISIRATELETWERASVIIPNADILSNRLMNWTLKDKLGRIDINIGVAYGSDLERVRHLLLSVAQGRPGILGYPEPTVVFRNFGDSSLDFQLRCYTNDVFSRLRLSSDMRFDIERRFRETGIEIPFPQRTVHVVASPAPVPPAGGQAEPPAAAAPLHVADGLGK